jgi:hypothetical protein
MPSSFSSSARCSPVKTLDVAENLDFDYAIGGHGDVMRGKQTFELWKQYLRDLLDQTADAYADGTTLEQAKKRVSDYLVSKYAAKFDPKFPAKCRLQCNQGLPGRRFRSLMRGARSQARTDSRRSSAGSLDVR